ncbi:RDD family protein [Nibricoccus aquaticus]|nr:RDD family protein [Nibricoccus aquaticus]
MKPFRFIFCLLGAMAGLSLTWVMAEDASPVPVVEGAVSVQSADAAPEVERGPAPAAARESGKRRVNRDRDITKWGSEAVVPAGEEVDNLVALFGPVHVDGKVDGNAVAVFGPVFLSGTGSADGNVVAVLGTVRIDGPVEGNVVSVLGGVELGPKARVDGNVVSVGAPIQADPEAVVKGNVVEAATFAEMPELTGLQAWVRHALLLGRPLALRADVLWAWGVAGLFLALYLFIALVMNGALVKCAETLEQRPGKTVLAAFLAVLLTPLLFVVLSVTVVGAPVLMLALGVVSLIGKAAFLCWLGRRVTLALGLRHALPAVLIGGVLITLLYLVPFLGFVVMKLTDMLGVGMVVYTMMLAGRREKLGTAGSATSTRGDAGGMGAGGGRAGVPVTPMGPVMTASEPGMSMSMGFAAMPPPPPPVVVPEATGAGESMASPAAVGVTHARATSGILPKPVSTVPITSALPRAGFGVRLGALLIDATLVFFVVLMISRGFRGGPGMLAPGMAVYLIALWGLKGTTIGGIICGLKVVRLDDRPLDWTTAVVRGLAGFLSVLPAGLGFLWVAFDEEKQSWHDKVAGTVVVHAPKGMSLV